MRREVPAGNRPDLACHRKARCDLGRDASGAPEEAHEVIGIAGGPRDAIAVGNGERQLNRPWQGHAVPLRNEHWLDAVHRAHGRSNLLAAPGIHERRRAAGAPAWLSILANEN